MSNVPGNPQNTPTRRVQSVMQGFVTVSTIPASAATSCYAVLNKSISGCSKEENAHLNIGSTARSLGGFTSRGSPKVTSFRASRDQAKDQNLQVLCCCISIFPGFFSGFTQQIMPFSPSATVVCFCAQRRGLFSRWNLVKMCGFLGPAAKTEAVQTKQTQKPSRTQSGAS